MLQPGPIINLISGGHADEKVKLIWSIACVYKVVLFHIYTGMSFRYWSVTVNILIHYFHGKQRTEKNSTCTCEIDF